MRQHVLYMGHNEQIEKATRALKKLKAKPTAVSEDFQFARYELTHPMLDDMHLEITLIKDISAITSQLRHNAIDLLIYDERGEDGIEALEAVKKIRTDVKGLARHWGPDFLFPMSRVVTILEGRGEEDRHRIFSLGKLNVRDVFVDPKSTVRLLIWLKDVLWHGIKRDNKVGMALSGGGLEGFLYQLGALHALQACLSGGHKSLRECDVISGVSSGALAGSLFASDVPLIEVIRSFNGTSKVLPKFTSRTLFDVAATDMTKRIFKHTTNWTGLDVKAILNNTMRSIPTGFFKGDSLEKYFRDVIALSGGEDEFPKTDKPKLFLGATDQDTFQHVTFSSENTEGIPLSATMRASSALPPIFAPKQIDGKYFIDGQVTKTCDLELVIEQGSSLVIIINPLKPHISHTPGSVDKEGGVYGVIQTIKALVSTRLQSVLRASTEAHPDTDFIVFEPDEECAQLMAGSPMRYNIRTKVIWLAFRDTIRKISLRHQVYAAKFRRYGFELLDKDKLVEIEEQFLDEFPKFKEN